MMSGFRAWTQTGHGICLALGAGLLLLEGVWITRVDDAFVHPVS